MIAAASARHFTLPFRTPFQTTHRVLTERSGWIIRFTDAEGRSGYGECAPLPGWSIETMADIGEPLERALEMMEGWRGAQNDPLAIPDELEVQTANLPSLRFGIQSARLDLIAKRLGVPAKSLLAENPLDRVPLNALLSIEDDGKLIASALAKQKAGYGTFKLKVSHQENLKTVALLRDTLGPDARIRLDTNRAWEAGEALQFLTAAAVLDIEYIEEPLQQPTPQALVRLRRQAPIPLAADESARDENGVTELLDEGAVDVVVLKPMLMGGVDHCLRLGRLCREHGVHVVVTTALESAIGRAMVAQVAASIVNEDTPCGLDTGGLFDGDVATEGFQIEGGYAVLSDEPGIGLAQVPWGPA